MWANNDNPIPRDYFCRKARPVALVRLAFGL